MDILFVGYSSIVRRKVLPAAIQAKNIEKISIASSKIPDLTEINAINVGQIFSDYQEAITDSEQSLVYISFPNALHARWVEKALRAGHHVVVDKPAFMSHQEARKLTDLAIQNNLLLAEANVWTYHPLFKEIKKHVESKTLHSVYANFSSPPLEPNNFRYDPVMGAGILFDRGSYVASCVRELFNHPPERIFCSQRFSKTMQNVDTSLSIMMNFRNKSTFLGFFSLECEYTNRLEIIGEDFKIVANRIFTPPPDQALEFSVTQKNDTQLVTFEPCDTFQAFLEDAAGSIADSTSDKFSKILLEDALLLEGLLESSR